MLKRWRLDNGAAADVSGLPNDLVEVVKSLYERVQQMGDHRIEQARDEFKVSNDELRKELTEARNTIAQLTARQQDLNNQLSRVIEKKASKTSPWKTPVSAWPKPSPSGMKLLHEPLN